MIIKTIEDQLNVLASPFLRSVEILDDDTLMATLVKRNIHLDRPLAIGTTILGIYFTHLLSHPQPYMRSSCDSIMIKNLQKGPKK